MENTTQSTTSVYSEVSLPLVQEMAGILAARLGWTEVQKKAEVQRTVELLKERHGVELG